MNNPSDLTELSCFQILKDRNFRKHFFDRRGFSLQLKYILPLQAFRLLNDLSESFYSHCVPFVVRC